MTLTRCEKKSPYGGVEIENSFQKILDFNTPLLNEIGGTPGSKDPLGLSSLFV